MFAEVVYFCEHLYLKIILSYIPKMSIKIRDFEGLNVTVQSSTLENK